MSRLDVSYPSGIRGYCERARALLESSKRGDNPFAGMVPEVPDGVKLDYGDEAFVAAEDEGLRVFNRCAFVLVAGGLGERLGYSGIKVELPTEITTGRSYLQLYIEQILARQRACAARTGDARRVPLVIMTSDDTHTATVKLLADNANFGMETDQVVILKQEKVAALLNNAAHFAKEDKYTIETKPHGHGDVHALLHMSGLARKWAAEGREYVVFFQDTNSLCFTVTIAAVGVSVQRGFAMNSITTPRKAKDAVGAIAKLVPVEGTAAPLTINVEYNQLEPMLLASGFPEGDVNDATGFSKFPGNINQLVVHAGAYADALDRSGGQVPEFVNPKYADAAKTTFKKPTRLECMMQELPRLLQASDLVGFTQFPEWTYSPVKNSIDEARAKFAAGVPMRCASEGELELYAAYARQLRFVGVQAAPSAAVFEVSGFRIPDGPHVVLAPSFAVGVSQLRQRFPNPDKVRISARSTLVLEGDVTVESLDLDGALVVRALPGTRSVISGLRVHNEGYRLVPLDPAAPAPDSLKIRGYDIDRRDATVLLSEAFPPK